MCIAILNRKENPVLKAHFKNSLFNNSDGFGMAWIEGEEIKTFKSLSTDSNRLYKKYLKVFEATENPMLLHFRISTSGGINLDNTHPFHVSKNLVFMHNGIISGLGNALENDTRHFNRLFLQNIRERDILGNNAIQNLISHRIGHSKLVFLNSQGKTAIINPNLGIEETDGNWYSNGTYSYGCEWQKPKAKSKNLYWWNDEEEDQTVFTNCSCCDNYKRCEFDGLFKTYLCKDCQEWIEAEN